MDIVYFIVLVGVLIFVHELGHFAWAKFFGVRVLKFSLGFGPTIAGFRRGETEYVIAALPLGGYVRMLGENPLDEVPEGDEGRTFHGQPFWKKLVITAAGPAMNLLFPLLLFFIVFVGEDQMLPPVVGTVFPDRPADGRLLPGDRIVAIDGEPMSTFDQVSRTVGDSPGQPMRFEIERAGQSYTVRITPVLSRHQRELDLVDEVGRIGIRPHHPTAVIGVTSPASPAAASGLRTFDKVVAVSGRPIERWSELDDALRRNRGALVPVAYLRPERLPGALGGLVELDVYAPHVATLTPEPGRTTSGTLRAGLEPADLYISHVNRGSPEHRLGLLPGDRLVTLDGRPVRLWATFLEDLRAGRGEEHSLVVRRGDRLLTRRYRLAHQRGVDELGERYDYYSVGIRNWVPMRLDDGVDNPSPVGYAITRAFESSWEMVELTVFSVVRLLQGRLSVKSIGGPLAIFDVAGSAAREGPTNYLRLMAFISINLGLINLMPIPMLDGGHLMFFLVEAVTRRRVSAKVRGYASLAGLVVLLLLMGLAFKNDIERQWPKIQETFSTPE